MSDLGIAAEVAELRREIRQLRQEIREREPGVPASPELGEVTGVGPLVVTRSDNTAVTVEEIFGGTGAVGDAALVLYPEDAGPVAFLKGAPSLCGAAFVSQGNVSALVPNNVNGPTINVQIGQSVACLMFIEVQEWTGSASAAGDVSGDDTGTAGFVDSENIDAEWSVAANGKTTFLVTRHALDCDVAGTWAPQADFFISSGTIGQRVSFFWMVY